MSESSKVDDLLDKFYKLNPNSSMAAPTKNFYKVGWHEPKEATLNEINDKIENLENDVKALADLLVVIYQELGAISEKLQNR